METPVGNPSVSLLPQPAVPAPIEPMRGGGGPENVSLLPQPTVLAPIEPMKGGGPSPILQLSTYQKPVIDVDQLKTLENQSGKLLTQEMNKYNFYRKSHPWTEEQMKVIQKKDARTFLPHKIVMDNETNVFVYFVYDYIHYLQVIIKIRSSMKNPKLKDKRLVYIIIDNTTNTNDFSNIYRTFIKNVVELKDEYLGKEKLDLDNFQLYFIFDKTSKEKNIDWKPTETASSRAFYWLEPDSICITYDFGGKDMGLCFIPTLAVNDSLNKYSGITPDKRASNITFTEKGLKRIKKISELMPNTSYTIDTKKRKEFWKTEYLFLSLKDEVPIEPSPEEDRNNVSLINTSLFSNDKSEEGEEDDDEEEEEDEDEEPKVTKPRRIFEVKSKKDVVPIDLGGLEFTIRKLNDATLADWQKGVFSDDEKALFEAIGINEEFLAQATVPLTPQNQEILEIRKQIINNRSQLLQTLTTTSCLNTSDYLLASECSSMRKFLSDLMYIRQIDRLRAFTKGLSEIEDFDVEMKRIDEERRLTGRSIDEVLDSLIPTTRVLARRIVPIPPGLNTLIPSATTLDDLLVPSVVSKRKIVDVTDLIRELVGSLTR